MKRSSQSGNQIASNGQKISLFKVKVNANAIKILFLYTIRYLLPYFSHRIQMAIGDAIGRSLRTSRQAKIMQLELQKLLGSSKTEGELLDIAAEGIGNHIKDLFEIWSFPRMSKDRIKKIESIKGKEHLEKALEKGKGVLIGVSHFGSWKMIIAALAYEGYPVSQIGLDPRFFIDEDQPRHHNLIMEMEYASDQSLPAKFIYIGKFMRSAYRALSNNELVIDSFDGFIDKNKKTVSFLKGTNTLALGPIILAIRTGASLVPVFIVRQKDNRHCIEIHKEIPLNKDGDEDKVIQRAADVYGKIFEAYVLRNPSHYCRTLYDRVRDPRR